MDADYQLALLLQSELNDEELIVINESPRKKGKENNWSHSSKTNSLVDPELEFIDPTPDIHALFIQFNDRFFWKKLHAVEVRWSPRMTSCAGVCVYEGRGGFCSVRLSLPLLKLRPRKDLVETLLHEMIHAYLFVTHNNRDRDGHGPEFHKHMNRINQEAGTHISVYHSFHDEVRLYQQHWWRCNGPCQHKPPFFGTVRRAMNRAPGPYDNWWAQHQAQCSGKFIKVKEPDDTKKKTASVKTTNTKGDIRSFFPGGASSSKQGAGQGTSSNMPLATTSSANNFKNHPGVGDNFKFKKGDIPKNSSGPGQLPPIRGQTSNNVHSLGNTNDSWSSTSVKPVANPLVNNVFGFRDLKNEGVKKPSPLIRPNDKGHVLGGSIGEKGKSYPKAGGWGGMLSNKGSGTFVVSGSSAKAKNSKDNTVQIQTASSQTDSVKVFSGTGNVLGNGIPEKAVASGSRASPLLTESAAVPSKRVSSTSFEDTKRKKTSVVEQPLNNGKHNSSTDSTKVPCPVCSIQVLSELINSHLDDCINGSSKTVVPPEEVIILSDSEDDLHHPNVESKVDCPGCNKPILQSQMDSHLSECLSSSFQEEDFVSDKDNKESSLAKCPMCSQSFPVSEMDKHIENCPGCSLQDLSLVFEEDFSDEEEDAAVGSPSKRITESGERLYPCPCCLILVESTKMNEHLDDCVV